MLAYSEIIRCARGTKTPGKYWNIIWSHGPVRMNGDLRSGTYDNWYNGWNM